MKKKKKKALVITLYISLVLLIIAAGCSFVYENNKREAEEARIEQELKAAEEEKAKEEAAAAAKEEKEEAVEEEEYTFTEFDEDEYFYTASKAVIREEPDELGEIINTYSLNNTVTAVAQCDQTDYYKIKINGDYGYISPEDVSEDYYEVALPISGDVVIPSASKDILFIGNSITLYPATEDWWGSGWGCGATSADKDYVHLTVAAKGYSSYDYMSMRKWEFANCRNNELTDLDGYIKNYQYSTIVIELGENVKGHERHFKEDFLDMIKYIRTYNPNARIVILDNFWKYDSIISTKKAVASEAGATYVSLSGVQGVAQYQLQSGDTYTTEAGVTYTIGSFLAGHPNDAGFAAIAERLIAAL